MLFQGKNWQSRVAPYFGSSGWTYLSSSAQYKIWPNIAIAAHPDTAWLNSSPAAAAVSFRASSNAFLCPAGARSPKSPRSCCFFHTAPLHSTRRLEMDHAPATPRWNMERPYLTGRFYQVRPRNPWRQHYRFSLLLRLTSFARSGRRRKQLWRHKGPDPSRSPSTPTGMSSTWIRLVWTRTSSWLLLPLVVSDGWSWLESAAAVLAPVPGASSDRTPFRCR
jgi:hypothetical protein